MENVGCQILEHIINQFEGTIVDQVIEDGAEVYVREYLANNEELIDGDEDREKIVDETVDALIDYVVRKHNNKLADELLTGLSESDPSYDDHVSIAHAIQRGVTKGRILGLAEAYNWPDTYVWLDDNMYAPGERL